MRDRVGIDPVNLKGGGKELFDRIISKAEYISKARDKTKTL